MVVIAALAAQSCGQADGPDYPIAQVPLENVSIQDDFWSPRLAATSAVTIPHVLEQCRKTGRIDNFAKAAGRLTGPYVGYWFNDSDVYKAIEGAAYSLKLHPDRELEASVDQIIELIAAAQWPDGYLYTPHSVPQKQPQARFAHLRDSHELYCAGHLFEAGTAYYRSTGKRTLLDVARRLADLLDETFGPDKRRDVDGHQEVELGLVKLYRVTGEEKYLRLARFFLDERGRASGRALYGPYCQDHQPVLEQIEAVGHAVRATYMYSSMMDVAALCSAPEYAEAAVRLWQNVVGRKLYLIGGIGAAHGIEGFAGDGQLPNASAYCETCASIASVFWNERLFLYSGEAKYIDVLERALYNALLAGVSRSGDTFFYVNPLESDGARGFNFGSPLRRPWFDCACCPPNVARFLPTVGWYAYAQRGRELYVNLYLGSEATVDLAGTAVRLKQETTYPWSGRVALHVAPEKPAQFALLLRLPGWARGEVTPGGLYRFADGEAGPVSLAVNGEAQPLVPERGFLRLERQWRPGDEVVLDLPLPIRRVESDPIVEADAGKVALQRGPLVYCAEGVDNGGAALDLALPDDLALRAEPRPDLLGGVTVLAGSRPGGGSFVALPYYAWAERGAGEMTVWFWKQRPPVVPLASHCFSGDTVRALGDGILPAGSKDTGIPRFTFWDHLGTAEWVQYTFAERRTVSAVEVYWFDDGPEGGVRLPASWEVLYRPPGERDFRPVAGASPRTTAKDCFNRVTFTPVAAEALRLSIRLQDGFTAGILEWRVQ